MGLSLLWSQLGEGLEWGDSRPDSHCPSLLLWISGTLLTSGPFATPRELKNLPWSQLLQAAVGPVVLVPEGPLELAGSLAYNLELLFFPGHIF